VAYIIFVILYVIPSHHHLANASSATENDDLQLKVLLTGKIEAPSNTKVKSPVEGVLSEEKKKEEYMDFAAIHDASMKVGVSSSLLSSVYECVQESIQQCFSLEPSAEPSLKPSAVPSLEPSLEPSTSPSLEPSSIPSLEPSLEPSTSPSLELSAIPSHSPTSLSSSPPTGDPTSDSTETPICSDDTSWRYDNESSNNCGWVYLVPDRRCSKRSVDGVRASEACPIACGNLRTKACGIPYCMNDSWYNNVGESCNDHLPQGTAAKKKCKNIGEVTTLGNNQNSFAYEYCYRCSGYSNACVPNLSTRVELKEAVSDYCANPEAWTTNPKYAMYGPIEEWDVSSIDTMYQVFQDQSNCSPNIADWDVSGVTNFVAMFYLASSFDQDIGGWDVSNGTRFVSDAHGYAMIDC